MKKRFGIDIDGTVTHPASIIPYINKEYNLNTTLRDIKEYDLAKALQLDPKVFNEWYLTQESNIYKESPLAEGAKDVLSKWKSQYQLYFISARGSHFLELTKNWFNGNDLLFDHIELIGSHHKAETARKYRVDLFFEDKHDNAVTIYEELKIPVILFDTPYNQDPVPEGVIRVQSWKDAEAWVENWEKEQLPND